MLWSLTLACFPLVCYHTCIRIFERQWHEQFSRLYFSVGRGWTAAVKKIILVLIFFLCHPPNLSTVDRLGSPQNVGLFNYSQIIFFQQVKRISFWSLAFWILQEEVTAWPFKKYVCSKCYCRFVVVCFWVFLVDCQLYKIYSSEKKTETYLPFSNKGHLANQVYAFHSDLTDGSYSQFFHEQIHIIL